MTIRFGVSPIAWINDDMPELGGDTPVETVLQDIQELGFSGVELGGKFPRDPNVLRALLSSHHLGLVGGWYSSSLLFRSAEAEIEAMRGHLDLLQALGSSVFVIAETRNVLPLPAPPLTSTMLCSAAVASACRCARFRVGAFATSASTSTPAK